MDTPERHELLKDNSPATEITSNTDSPSPAQRLSFKHRPGYARVPSVSFNEDALARDITESTIDDGVAPVSASEGPSRSHGLGIAMGSTTSRTPRISSPLSSHEIKTPLQATPVDRPGIYSPPSTGGMSGSTKYDQAFTPEDTSYPGALRHAHKDSRTSLSSTLPPSIYARSEAGLLHVRSQYHNHSHPQSNSFNRSVKSRRLGNWVSITILGLAVFSTIFAVMFLLIALSSPRWGRRIRNTGGSLTPSSAAFLTSLFAKLIELSFVTVVVAFVGQALARRAFKLENARGITLAEMSMRQWIMQPGTLLTNWESVKYAGVSLLGLVSLLAAVMAILYTSAATALVQPQLGYPDWRHITMGGRVKTSFANPNYIADNCQTPISAAYDPDYRSSTCLAMYHAAKAFHNYDTWLGTWTDMVNNGSSGGDLDNRPPGYAIYLDNTTITAPFIERKNVTVVNETRWINNITMAMPHTGVLSAAQDPTNGLMQPSDVDGASIDIIASVPSPMVNVLCVTMTAEDLTPFVYELWDDHDPSVVANATGWDGWPHNYDYMGRNATLGGTPWDDYFQWGAKYGTKRDPPVFPRLPIQYNTLVNDTVGFNGWGRQTIYLLGRGGLQDWQGNSMINADGNATNYALCQLQVGLTDKCSTRYTASASGASLYANCEDPNDKLQYSHSNPGAWAGMETYSADWPSIASLWATTLSLNAGIMDGNASNARLLTEFILTGNQQNKSQLITSMPSMAEALAVLAGCTLIDSITDAPFVGKPWNYSINTLTPGQYQYFSATVQDQQYLSGGSQAYQKAFYLVLFIVAIMNIVILVYFLAHRDWYTDFSEPVAMFSIAVNSPPSEKLAGTSATGPVGDQYRLSWKLNNDGGHYYYVENEAPQEDVVPIDSPRWSRRRWTDTFEMISTPNLKKRLSR